MTRVYLFCSMMLLLLSTPLHAQRMTNTYNDNDADDNGDPYEHRTYFMTGMEYLSNNVYLGRKDSIAIPYYSPYIGYHWASGLYCKGMVSYTTAKNGRIDLATLEGGYDHNFGDNFTAGFSADKFFYNKNSTSIRSATKGGAGIYGQYNNDYIEPQLSFDVNVNSHSTDYVLAFNLDHDFGMAHNTVHVIPMAGVALGTQHYYDEYFIARLNKLAKKDKVKSVVENPDQLVPLVYELSTQGTYRVGKWLIGLQPTYAIPLSPATVTINKKTYQEKLSNSFYVAINVCLR